MKKKTVVLGMSGGVDSSTAAALLLEQGYDVIGVTMQIWPDKSEQVLEVEGGCCSLSAVDDARRVADKLGIKYYVLNFKELFDEKVICNFVDEYLEGRTPNPCIVCNKYIKFHYLLKKALSIGADYVATGHYARITYDQDLQRYLLKKSDAGKKDQTYFLYNFTQEQLEHTLMPLADYNKDQIREIAARYELPVAKKKESQDICFVEDGNHAGFIETRIGKNKIKRGSFVDKSGKSLGTHEGIVKYTIGQRRGLNLPMNERVYVTGIDAKNNTVIVGKNEDLFSKTAVIDNVNLISIDKLTAPMKVEAKIRYSVKESSAIIEPLSDGKIKATFEQPQRAITPGQSMVFYDGDIVVGGGVIIG